MSDLNTNATNGATTPATEERTFTQDEVNKIVQDRLAKERNKQTPPPLSEKELELAEREKELSRKEFEHSAREILKENDLPDEILTVLNVSDADGLKNALDILDKIFDFSDKDAGAYSRNPDGTWKKHRKGPDVPRFADGVGQFPMIGNGPSKDELIRQGMGLK